MNKKAIHLIVSGRVQGVGFRYFAHIKAMEFNISGWVRNTPDGKLEIEAEGEPEQLQPFIDWIKIGPSRGIVKQFNISEITPIRNFDAFTIR